MATASKAELTPKQAEVYEFIVRETMANRYGPTTREIGDHFGFSSPNAVMYHVLALEKKGLLELSRGKSRSITVLRAARIAELRDAVIQEAIEVAKHCVDKEDLCKAVEEYEAALRCDSK